MNGVVENPSSQVPTRDISRPQWMPYLLFTFCATIYLLPFMRLLLEGTDEGTLISGAARIVHGQVFARDFFEAVGPGTFYWLAMFFKLFGVTFVATRICLFISSLGTALLLYFLSRRICGRYSTLPCVLIGGMYFRVLWPAISHHVDSNFFALGCVACTIIWHDTRKRTVLFLAGGLAGLTTCFHQPKGILLLVSLSVWCWTQRRRSAYSAAQIPLIAGYLAVTSVVLLYFWRHGALWDLTYVNFVWPSQNYAGVNTVPYAFGLRSEYWDKWIVVKNGFWIIFATIMILPFLFVTALPGLLLFWGAWQRRISCSPDISLYWFGGWALWASEIHRKDIFHLVFGSPLLIILGVFYLGRAQEKTLDWMLQVLAISASCLATFHLFLVLLAHPVQTRIGSVAMFQGDPAIAILKEMVAPGEEIYAYPYCPMYYFLSEALNPTRYSFLMYGYNTPSQFLETIRVLDQRQVRFVVWNTAFRGGAQVSFFPGAKSDSTESLIVEPYLEAHYDIVWTDANTRIMKRKSR